MKRQKQSPWYHTALYYNTSSKAVYISKSNRPYVVIKQITCSTYIKKKRLTIWTSAWSCPRCFRSLIYSKICFSKQAHGATRNNHCLKSLGILRMPARGRDASKTLHLLHHCYNVLTGNWHHWYGCHSCACKQPHQGDRIKKRSVYRALM